MQEMEWRCGVKSEPDVSIHAVAKACFRPFKKRLSNQISVESFYISSVSDYMMKGPVNKENTYILFDDQ